MTFEKTFFIKEIEGGIQMRITVEIPDEEIKECLKAQIVSEIMSENSFGTGARFRKEYKEIIKELIYQPQIKQSIIEMATKEAAYELRRKGMPLLMEKLANDKEEG